MMLFLGAGASKPFGITPMKEMSQKFENKANGFTDDEKELYQSIRNELGTNNLEHILTVLNDLSNESLNPSIKFFKKKIYEVAESLPRKRIQKVLRREKPLLKPAPIKDMRLADANVSKTFDKGLSGNLKSKIIEFIKEKCNIDAKIKQNTIIKADIESKYERFFEILENNSSSFNIFTTNYDRVIENYFESEDKFYDGFTCKDPRICDWQPEGYDKDYKFKLFKLHGSVDQYIENGRIIKCWREPRGAENAMIYPMREKEVYKDPFFELFTCLKSSLLSEKICIVIGYSFGDEHIRNIFFDAVKRNSKIRIFLISPDAKKIRDNLESIKDNIEPIEGKFGEVDVFDELKQKLSEV